jgi:hypothetical protein
MSSQNQQWQYIAVTISNEGKVGVVQPDGTKGFAPDGEHYIIVLNRFGHDGWELVQGGVNPDSSGKTYLMKRPVPAPVPEPGIN